MSPCSGSPTSFDTPDGTRGKRLASGRFDRWWNAPAFTRVGRTVFRRMMGCDVLLLTTIGRRSGTARTTPVAGFSGKDGSWLIVAAAGGTAANPAWYRNIAAHPDEVQIEVGGRTVTVAAEQLHGAERAEAWEHIIATSPQFARFQQHTDRQLPVIRLTPRSVSQAPHH
jgi:deazaflavin-dependent oxidoreductase (nitroreductase family)